MYSDLLLTVIALTLVYIAGLLSVVVGVVRRFNPDRIVSRSVQQAVTAFGSKQNIKRIETNTMPFILKIAAVKIATFVAIRYIGKKLK